MRMTLPDGSERELPDGATGADLAASIGPGLARAALAIRIVDGSGNAYEEGRIRDLALPVTDGEKVEIVTAKADDRDSVGIWPHAQIISVRVFAGGGAGSSVPAYLTALEKCRDRGATRVEVTQEANDDQEEGNVFAQDPERGEKVDEGSTVRLKVSAGAQPDAQLANTCAEGSSSTPKPMPAACTSFQPD